MGEISVILMNPGKRIGNRSFRVMGIRGGLKEVDKKASCFDVRLSPNLFLTAYTTGSACDFW